MSERITRRSFLVAAVAAAGGIALGVLRWTGREARRMIRIPFKPFDRSRLREPHDLAG